MKTLIYIILLLLVPGLLHARDNNTLHFTRIKAELREDYLTLSFRLQSGKEITGRDHILVLLPVIRTNQHRQELAPITIYGRRAATQREQQMTDGETVREFRMMAGQAMPYAVKLPY